jgi:hypothetical protein
VGVRRPAGPAGGLYQSLRRPAIPFMTLVMALADPLEAPAARIHQ